MNVNEENNDSENENVEEENTEESPEENTDNEEPDIDQSEEIPEELSYQEQLEKYFEEIEAKFGITKANEIRQKITSCKQLEYFLDADAWGLELSQMQTESINRSKEQSELIFKIFKAEIAQLQELRKAQIAFIEESRQLNREMHDRYMRSFDESDELQRQDHAKIQELMKLKKEKMATQ